MTAEPAGDDLRWRALLDGSGSGPRNMAVDEALARSLGPGRGVLRLYRWDAPTISLGRNQPARERYDRREAALRGISFVRRPTGGRAVVHHREVTYAVAVPVGALGGLRETYRAVNGALVAGLRALGVEARLAPEDAPTPTLDGRPCFDAPAAGEVVAGGRKLVGSAQCRIRRAILQHGSVLLDDDQGALAAVAREGAPPAPPATLAGVLGSAPEWDAVARALVEGFREVVPGSWGRGAVSGAERKLAGELETRYASEEWTWRR